MQSVTDKVIARIYGRGRGWAFTKNDFIADFTDVDVRKSLSQLAKKGVIRRVCTGVYDYPKYSQLLNQELSPDMEQVAYAIARKFKWRIQPSGNTALNYLGLSTQVPVHYLYISDGPDRSYNIGNIQLDFKHTALKEAGFKYKESALIVQALKALGKERVDEAVLNKMKEQFRDVSASQVLKDTKHVTIWIYNYIQLIFKENPDG